MLYIYIYIYIYDIYDMIYIYIYDIYKCNIYISKKNHGSNGSGQWEGISCYTKILLHFKN